MMLEIGRIVKSVAGRDKDSYCFLRDGKVHKLEHPKRKSFKHVQKSPFKLQSEALQVNKHLKKAIDSLTNS